MTVTLSTAADISQRTNVYADMKMLDHAEPILVLEKFAEQRDIPPNKSTTIKFRRPKVFAPATAPLQEGVTPPATPFGFEDVTATVKQQGDFSYITDVIMDTHEDPVLNEMVEQHGENRGRTIEALLWAVVRAGTSVFYANGSSRSAVNKPVSLPLIQKAVRYLKEQKAKPITKVADGSEKYSTFPIEGAYIAICHTDLEADIRALPGFVTCDKYGTKTMASPHEFGSVNNVRFVCSPDLDPFQAAGASASGSGMVADDDTNIDVYPIIMFGRQAYGCTKVRGKGSVKTMIVNPNPSISDPLAQRGSVGWKMWFVAVRLNENWMTRCEVAARVLV